MSLVTQEHITGFIPQKEPFILVHTLEECMEKLALSSFTVPGEHVLVKNGCLSEEGLTENMAQTAAAHSGYMAHLRKETVPVGFIGQIKSLEIAQLPPVGSTIHTRVDFVHQVGPVSVIECTATLGETLLASCEMKIFLHFDTPKKD